MSFASYIERLRKLPQKERRQIAAGWTFAIMAVIALWWFISFVAGFGTVPRSPILPEAPAPAGSSGITPPF